MFALINSSSRATIVPAHGDDMLVAHAKWVRYDMTRPYPCTTCKLETHTLKIERDREKGREMKRERERERTGERDREGHHDSHVPIIVFLQKPAVG